MPISADEQKELELLELEKLQAEKDGATKSRSSDEWRDFRSPLARTGSSQETKSLYENRDKVRTVGDSIQDLGVRSAPAALGQYGGSFFGPLSPAAVPLLGGVGGVVGEVSANAMEHSPNTAGKIVSAFITGAIPGAPLAKAGTRQVLREGAKFAAGEVAATEAQSLIDKGELADSGDVAMRAAGGFSSAGAAKLFSVAKELSEERKLYALRDKAFKDLQPEGVKIPPHEVGQGSDVLSSVGGKAALSQQAAKENQYAWQKLTREEIGLSKEALPIKPEELKALRDQYAEPYQKIQEISEAAKKRVAEVEKGFNEASGGQELAIKQDDAAKKLADLQIQAGADVDLLKDIRMKAQRAYRSMAENPNAYDDWQKYKIMAEALENNIEQAAALSGDNTLLKRLRESRKKLAQVYEVEDALNPSTGLVDPVSFGRTLDRREPLTGNLEKIAKFQLAFNREAVEATRVPAPNVGNIGAKAAASNASRGTLSGIVGGITDLTAGKPARGYLLSKQYQEHLARDPEYQNFLALLARFGTQKESEQVTEESSPRN